MYIKCLIYSRPSGSIRTKSLLLSAQPGSDCPRNASGPRLTPHHLGNRSIINHATGRDEFATPQLCRLSIGIRWLPLVDMPNLGFYIFTQESKSSLHPFLLCWCFFFFLSPFILDPSKAKQKEFKKSSLLLLHFQMRPRQVRKETHAYQMAPSKGLSK